MTAASQGEVRRRRDDPGGGGKGHATALHIGVVLEAFLDWPLERVLTWLPEAAPEVTYLEIGAGGYAPHPHCDVAGLLASDQARSPWLAAIAHHGLQVDALNAWGNPLHPDQDLAREHDQALRDAIRLAGPVESACAQATTFIRERAAGSAGAGGGTMPVTVDDAASALLRFESGALGTLEVARAAVRRPCDFTVEANGSHGTLMFDYARLNELWYASTDDDVRLYGMRRIRAEHPSHPYAAQWWPIGQGVGYGASFANQVADLLEGWPEAPWTPGFREGAAVQAVCDAMETSAASGRWVRISEVNNGGNL